MTFLKAVWRFIVAIKDLMVLCFLLLFFGALYAALSFKPGDRPVSAHDGALLVDLDGYLVEQPEEADPISALFGSEAPVKQYRLRDVVSAVETAGDDARVKAVVLDLDGFMGGGQVSIERLGKALDTVRTKGKPVLSYATAYNDDSYQLAAHGSEIWLNPLGGVAITGPGGSNLYFKGLIDKLGITAHIYRVGTYKSAVEPLMRSDQSPEAKAAMQALADNLWSNWQQDVGKARPGAQIASYSANPLPIVQAARGDLANAALAARLADKLGDRPSFEARVAELAGAGKGGTEPAFAMIALGDYTRAHRPSNDGDIGVLTIAGDIVDGEAGPGTAAGDSIVQLLDETLEQRDLKALVVRVDSPGGSVLASERIRAAIANVRARGIPVVASMGNVAASGGYWVSTAANRIIAEPATITGSIGVFGVLPSFEGLLEKLGVTTDGVRTTPLSGEPDVLGGVSETFNDISQLGVEHIYRRFLGLVAASRNMTPEQVDGVGQGRVWDGGTAHQLGLVDRFGGLEEAIVEAAKLAKIDPATARPYYIEPQPDPFTAFVTRMMESEQSAQAHASAGKDLLGRQADAQKALVLRAVDSASALASGGSVQARCLECEGYSIATRRTDTKSEGMLMHVLTRLVD
ncbi:MAG: signal peptide peptidase SppA [Sphingobium sp.]